MADWKNPPRLFIPGPVQVYDDVLRQLARPTLGHRGKEFAQLHGDTVDMLKKILFTEQNVFLSTSSACGIWEAAVRNCLAPNETLLATGCGAFSDKWASVARQCGANVDELKVDWGKPILPEMIDEKLATGKYAAITLVKLLKEGIENVWQRHKDMAEVARTWTKENFDLFCDEKYASNTLTAIKNTKGINVAETISAIQQKHNTIFGNGYGKLKEQTFRIAHMGDITIDDLKDLLTWIDNEIA